MTTFTLTENQLNDLVANVTKAVINTLTSHKETQTQTPTLAVDENQEKKMASAWETASTTAVSFWTLEQYDWKPLRKWCLDRNIEIEKETVNGLQINSYPAQAWLEVYGIVLGKFAW
ncbi:hypothetical protein LP109_01050 [Moraxella bovis]|uniref:hypothetical protein n=1 Tax=Moraxella bovis TaxID=476 RepID=UPI000993C64B|nr:hypothetical protein [Moraxella bovis]OOR87408.1 hypothetical protein B0182_12565 [Moraxella bovis]UZA16949.1 hypothetical protein LP109_01050 [Moraxella bovis]